MVLWGGGPLSASPPPDAPLILTLRLDPERQRLFDALRKAHFPAERNHLAAHATLFHKLPGAASSAIASELSRVAAETPPTAVEVAGPMSLGSGVAFRLISSEAIQLRRRLADHWRLWLTPQDRSWSRLHVTVQNKVTPAAARRLLSELSRNFAPQRFESPGLDLWVYCGGPWQPAARFDFRG